MSDIKNRLVIDEVRVSGRRIDYSYTVTGPWKDYFRLNNPFYMEYTWPDSIAVNPDIPRGVAVVPLLGNLLPMAFVFDGEIVAGEVDKDFVNCVEEFKQGYIEMYPRMTFGGTLTATPVDCTPPRHGKNTCAQFFSGGVDAFCTLFTHIEEKPILFTIWGSDVYLTDKKGWHNVESRIRETADEYGLDIATVKSCFRTYLREGKLSGAVEALSDENWWHGFQHGVGLIAHAAPLAYVAGLTSFYIASSYTPQMKGTYTCASDPTIDDYVRYCGCQTVHDGYELDRQQKVRRICEYARAHHKKVPLHVCWESTGGKNCGVCEKCYRTMMAVVVEGEDPNNYGFTFSEKDLGRMEHDLKTKITATVPNLVNDWVPLQQRLQENSANIPHAERYAWLLDMDINTFNDAPEKQRLLRWQRSLPARYFRKAQHAIDMLRGRRF